MTPTISVVLPTYNRLQMLIPVLDSILAQTVPVTEILVIDDGCSDETPERLPQLIAERPVWRGKVRYIRQENQGQSAALNRGIAEAQGEWIAFSSHDDLWLPWKLEWQFRALAETNQKCDLCFTDAWFMNNPHMKGTLFQQYNVNLAGPIGTIREPVRMIAECKYPVWVQTVLARASTVRHTGAFDSLLRYMEDQDFVFRMGLETPFCYVSMPMVLIDRSPSDLRHTGEALNWHKVEFRLGMDQRRHEKELCLGAKLPADIRKLIRRNAAANQSHWANLFLTRREFRKASAAMDTAASHFPSARIVAKRLLVKVLPRLARAVFVMRDRPNAPRYDQISWNSAARVDGTPSV